MEKITNKLFKNYITSQKKSGVDFDILEKCLDNIEEARTKRFQFTNLNGEHPMYHNFELTLIPYINSTKFKFVDLYNSLITSINISSFGAALAISRTIIEHFAMLTFICDKLEKYLNNKDYYNFAKILFSTGVDFNSKEILKNYKRIHVYDALRHFPKVMNKISKKKKAFSAQIIDVYDAMSEMTHAAPSSLLMYETTQKETNRFNDDKIKFSFSLKSDRIQARLFPLIAMQFYLAGLLDMDIYPHINKNLIDKFKDEKENINLYHTNNPQKGIEIVEMINFDKIDEMKK